MKKFKETKALVLGKVTEPCVPVVGDDVGKRERKYYWKGGKVQFVSTF